MGQEGDDSTEIPPSSGRTHRSLNRGRTGAGTSRPIDLHQETRRVPDPEESLPS